MEWFKSQTARDQIALVVGSIALIFYILIGMVYQPLQAKVANLQVTNTAAQQDLQWMVQSAAQVKALQGDSSKAFNVVQGSISQVVDSTVRQSGLKMKRFQPSGDNQAQVWLESVPYNAAISWLHDIENQFGFTIDSASINATSQPGLINLRVRLTSQ